jgi:twitching motility protein PilT
MIDRINGRRSCHIVTIEDPIEYVHKSRMSLISQRQVGTDAPSFNDALVSALRQDPDVILLGEIRDVDTIRTAIVAAETGHLVFTTLHAGDCVSSFERLIAVFPANEQEGIRRQLAMVVKAIVAQHLLSVAVPVLKDGTAPVPRASRIAVSEVLMMNSAVANLVSTGKSAQIYSLMETGQSQGMQTLEQDLARLWCAGQITEAVAVATSRNVNVLRSRVALQRKRESAALERFTGGNR